MNKTLLITIILLIVLSAGSLFFYAGQDSQEKLIVQDQTNILPLSADAIIPGSELEARAYIQFIGLFSGEKIKTGFNLTEPVEGFKERITKKPFGIYITPETSPVQPDKFTGYHTGVDVEFEDSSKDIPVLAIADGTILTRAQVAGYGGVVVIRHIINGVPIVALYGHLDPGSFLPPEVIDIKAGNKVGILGDGQSEETDGARKHLHFSLYPDKAGDKIDFRGYVEIEEELVNWLNPLNFYNKE